MKELTEIDATEVVDRDNLGVVYRVERLESIPNKDRIELVHLKDCGYTCICEKGHKIGDLVLFVKYDSILPQIEMFEFMRETKFRVKQKSFTERDDEDFVIKKIYSQGIVIPHNTLMDFMSTNYYDGILAEGVDLTAAIGITKYIPPVQKGAGSGFGQMQTKGDFPTSIVSKTDEVNLASKIRALDEIKGKRVYITLKLEGSSLTTMWDNDRDELMVCSRNNQIGEHETNKFWQAVNKYDLKNRMSEPAINFSIQAELYGSGIQKNKLGIDGVDMGVFNVVDKTTRQRLSYDDMVMTLEWLNLPMVPIVMIVEDFDMTFDELQQLADKQVYANGEVAEGIVIRPCEPMLSRVLRDTWSVKIINREYRL